MMLCILQAASLSCSFNLHSWKRPVISPPKAKVFSLWMAPFKFVPTPLERAEWPRLREEPGQPAFSRCWPACKTSPKTVKHPQRRAVKREKKRQRATKRLAGFMRLQSMYTESGVFFDAHSVSRLDSLVIVTVVVLPGKHTHSNLQNGSEMYISPVDVPTFKFRFVCFSVYSCLRCCCFKDLTCVCPPWCDLGETASVQVDVGQPISGYSSLHECYNISVACNSRCCTAEIFFCLF